MFRFVSELIGLLVLFSVVRSVITWVVRLFAATAQPRAESAPERPSDMGSLRSAGELQKDPVCGTFVPVASSLKLVVAGNPVYFCSRECRDRY